MHVYRLLNIIYTVQILRHFCYQVYNHYFLEHLKPLYGKLPKHSGTSHN